MIEIVRIVAVTTKQSRMKPNEPSSQSEAVAGRKEAWMEAVRSQVNSLRFGVVQIVVHDSRVVQIERTEKIRFGQPTDD